MTLVLVVDDHAVVRAGCRQLLQGWAGFTVTEACDGPEAMRKIAETQPDLVVLDLNLPGQGGFELIDRIKDASPRVRILVFTMHEDAAYAAMALERGAHGFVSKNDDPDCIVEAAKTVAAGEIYLSRPVAQKLALGKVSRVRDPLAALNRREREVLALFGQGKSLGEIAAHLGVSYKTTANACAQIKAKLGLGGNAEMMRLAVLTATSVVGDARPEPS